MATIQKRRCRGHTYWSIVESRRVNGKPRPVILKYLGTAEAFLERLTESIPKKVRSYSHGAVAVMLDSQHFWDQMDALPTEAIPLIEEEERFVPSRGWAEMIKKVYEIDPLICPKCGGTMRIVSFIEDHKVIDKIIKHLSEPPLSRFSDIFSFL